MIWAPSQRVVPVVPVDEEDEEEEEEDESWRRGSRMVRSRGRGWRRVGRCLVWEAGRLGRTWEVIKRSGRRR